MWPLTRRRNLRDELAGLKNVKINGIKFTIKKLNPLLDFPADRMPQVFTYYLKRRKVTEPQDLSIEAMRKGLDEMKLVVSAGVVSPKFSPELLTIDDIFRWSDTGSKLYLEIIAHSLNQFRGLKGVFFSIRIRRLLYTSWAKTMESSRSISSSPEAITP